MTTETNTPEKKVWIKCPHCGAEYTVDEIFTPGEIDGRTENVIKDALGRILYVEYRENAEPCHIEKFICDECSNTFIIEPILSFKTRKEAVEVDFGNLSTSLID